jgi:DNA ligase-1
MILYKKDTKGNIRFLKATTVGAELIQESGIVGTENPIEHRKTCKGKNIGRANETTPGQQALKEFESLLNEKLQEGYFKTPQEAQTEDTLFPMLAKDYKKESKKIDWKKPVYVQPKLDGMRCLITVDKKGVTLKSRDGRYIETMNHIIKDFKDVTHGVYDGELYAHGFSFQENMELIKKWVDGDEGSIQVKFHSYDAVTPGHFTIRLLVRDANIGHKKTAQLVETEKVKNETELKAFHKKKLAEGYEGTIVRHGDAEYKVNGRSSNLLKYKDFIDIACPIVDITPAEQRPEWGVPVLSLGDGRTFRAGMKYSHEKRVDFLKHKSKYIGKTAEIRFFEYSDTGIPRFPVMVGIRLDK